jgi:phosphatidylglycerol:prolipoprotein diacylglycerol transferase
MCIQGFGLGAIGTLVIGAWATGMPAGPLLDVTAPGLLVGMTIGRFGCFFGGCCAGRPTASRWGLWSSDRRLGVRRVPTQLLESTVALVVGLAALRRGCIGDRWLRDHQLGAAPLQ